MSAPGEYWVLGTAVLSTAAAPPTFPRGPGFYLNVFSFLAVVLVYLVWIRASVWVDHDARRLKLNRQGWNLLVFAGGGAGLVLFWALPWFPIAFALLLLLIGAPLAGYVVTRNPRVPEAERVCTDRHLRTLLNRHFKANVPLPESERMDEVSFLRKPGEDAKQGEPARVQEARKLEGFDAATQLLCNALERQAVLIQLDPAREWTQQRLRIDGTLHLIEQLPRSKGETLLPVFKSLSGLDVRERRKPQLGEFPVEINRRRLEVAVQSSGTIAGERIHLRLRERGQTLRTLDQLGLKDKAREQLGRILRHERGLFVICGMPDAGRTTTGYACLQEIRGRQRKVMTLEAQVEHRLPQVEQVQLERRPPETTATGFRRLLQRETPSAVLVDSPLDAEAAELVYDKATDHFLILVMEGEDSVAALARLMDLGLSATRLAKKLMGVLSQRLVRVLCPVCKVRYQPDAEVLRKVNLPAERIKHFARPPEGDEVSRNEEGELQLCPVCQGLGYRGRRAVFELLVMNDRIRELLRDGVPLTGVRQEAIRGGMTPQEDEALELVIAETTSISEIVNLLRTEIEPLPLASPSASEYAPASS